MELFIIYLWSIIPAINAVLVGCIIFAGAGVFASADKNDIHMFKSAIICFVISVVLFVLVPSTEGVAEMAKSQGIELPVEKDEE